MLSLPVSTPRVRMCRCGCWACRVYSCASMRGACAPMRLYDWMLDLPCAMPSAGHVMGLLHQCPGAGFCIRAKLSSSVLSTFGPQTNGLFCTFPSVRRHAHGVTGRRLHYICWFCLCHVAPACAPTPVRGDCCPLRLPVWSGLCALM